MARLARSSKVNEKSDQAGGSGTAMIVSTGDSVPSACVGPTGGSSGPGGYWSTETCSQRT